MNLIFFSKEKKHSGLRVPYHTHNCFEIIFYGNNASGNCIINQVEYEIKSNCIAVIPKRCSHAETHLSDTTVYFFGIDSIGDVPIQIYYDMHELKSIFSEIKTEIENQNNFFVDMVNLKINEILLRLKRTLTNNIITTKSLAFSKNYIEENYMNSIKISTLSKLSGYSYDHFRHLFTKNYGISPQQYIIECRINHALEYLTTTDFSCTKIAYLCGFSDSSQMTKIISSKYNKPPTQIRKEGTVN